MVFYSKEKRRTHPWDGPLCLLDETGKLFERIIAACLEAGLGIPGLCDGERGKGLAVSLDIVNALNIPGTSWDKIGLTTLSAPPDLVPEKDCVRMASAIQRGRNMRTCYWNSSSQ
ncbi:hypothetical protein K0M31_012820 [Melipona bicolor]|uniref:Uncharacterized protein n=1 Tax=Melipona bicolor TaxID=60889 RepID=A0AA40FJN4_9HYME|nr:hypothetical protein K0M31_012820 [Melipona bicolor]